MAMLAHILIFVLLTKLTGIHNRLRIYVASFLIITHLSLTTLLIAVILNVSFIVNSLTLYVINFLSVSSEVQVSVFPRLKGIGI